MVTSSPQICLTFYFTYTAFWLFSDQSAATALCVQNQLTDFSYFYDALHRTILLTVLHHCQTLASSWFVLATDKIQRISLGFKDFMKIVSMVVW